MTNEQIPCPVCGEEMVGDNLHHLCTNMECDGEGVSIPSDYIMAVNKAKDKAVQEERDATILASEIMMSLQEIDND